MELHKSGEDYLETILVLHRKTGHVRSIDIASELGFSKPSVSRAMGILREGGMINFASDGQITLTEAGLEVAEEVYNRHTLLTSFLREIIGVSAENAEADACNIEHVVSEETIEKLKRFADGYTKTD